MTLLHALGQAVARFVGCGTCHGTGLIELAAVAPATRGKEVLERMAPCACKAGDQWRQEFRWHLIRPVCVDCRRRAQFNFGGEPRCRVHDREQVLARAFLGGS